MHMKIHKKGQVVIPVQIRKMMGIEIGDMLDLHFDNENKELHLRRVGSSVDDNLSGRFANYASHKPFPSDEEISKMLEEGIRTDEKK